MKNFCKRKCRFLLTLCLATGILILSQSFILHTKAASDYEHIWKQGYDMTKKPLKIGKCYFKYNSSTRVYSVSQKKNSGYWDTPLEGGAYTNGKFAYYIRDNVLYQYTFSSRKEMRLKKLPVSGDESFSISTVYGRQVFLTKGSFDRWKLWTYSYDTKSGKLRKAVTGYSISDRHGKYVVGQNDYRTDVSPYGVTIYKIRSSGLSRIKNLSSYGRSETFVGNKLYYTEYKKETGMRKVSLYRCNIDGSNKKLIQTFTNESSYGETMILEITAKSCVVYKNGRRYRYNYKTKGMKAL